MTIQSFRVTILLTVVLLLVAQACGPYRPESNQNPMQKQERVVLLDLALTRYLNIVRHKANRLSSGQLEVKLEMENEEPRDLWADVQVLFQDDDGFELEKTNWEPVQFHKNGVTSFKKNSISAKDRIREI